MENEAYLNYLKTDKWRKLAKERMKIDENRCQMCGSKGTSQNPLEVHHMTYKHLYHEENWIYEDLVTVCHCCHKQIHALMSRTTNKDGRKGWKDSVSVPQISVFTISGSFLESEVIK